MMKESGAEHDFHASFTAPKCQKILAVADCGDTSSIECRWDGYGKGNYLEGKLCGLWLVDVG